VSDVAEPNSPPRRVRKFDRPPPPRDWRWWVGGIGKTLIAAGLLMFGFVAYQLWGTAIETARAQNALENEFEELLAAASTDGSADVGAPITTAPAGATPDGSTPDGSVPAGSVPPGSVPDPAPAPAPALPIEDGDPIARIEIPRIGVDHIVVAGVDKNDLKKGPGHYPGTPMPGQLGNSAIAGHRTTYGQPFFDVDKLQPGDEIVTTTLNGRFVYRVTGQEIVTPSDYQVIATVDNDQARLTLTSCHPKWTTRERIIIYADLDPAASSAPAGEALINYGRDPDPAADTATDPVTDTTTDTTTSSAVVDSTDPNATTSTTVVGAPPDDVTDPAAPGAVDTEIADAFSDGWFSDPGANSQVALWGLALAAIGIVSYLISRRAGRDWVGLTVGIVPFAVTLYFFFQNVNRLLPPSL
jgi:sortase A